MRLPRSSLLMRNGRIKIDIKTLDGLESRKLCEWFCTCFFFILRILACTNYEKSGFLS